MPYVVIAVIGVIGGVVSGLFGVGGGLVFVPLLIMMRGMDPHLAIGTSLAVVLPTALMGLLKHASAGMTDWRIVILIALFSVIGAWLGATLSLRLDGLLLKRLYSAFLLMLAIKLFLSPA